MNHTRGSDSDEVARLCPDLKPSLEDAVAEQVSTLFVAFQFNETCQLQTLSSETDAQDI